MYSFFFLKIKTMKNNIIINLYKKEIQIKVLFINFKTFEKFFINDLNLFKDIAFAQKSVLKTFDLKEIEIHNNDYSGITIYKKGLFGTKEKLKLNPLFTDNKTRITINMDYISLKGLFFEDEYLENRISEFKKTLKETKKEIRDLENKKDWKLLQLNNPNFDTYEKTLKNGTSIWINIPNRLVYLKKEVIRFQSVIKTGNKELQKIKVLNSQFQKLIKI